MGETPDGPPGAAEPPDEVKQRFKQALEHKQHQHRNARLHPEAGSSLSEPHGRSGGKRRFRRKSGG